MSEEMRMLRIIRAEQEEYFKRLFSMILASTGVYKDGDRMMDMAKASADDAKIRAEAKVALG